MSLASEVGQVVAPVALLTGRVGNAGETVGNESVAEEASVSEPHRDSSEGVDVVIDHHAAVAVVGLTAAQAQWGAWQAEEVL